MDIEKYITSGVLELYLSGTLEEEENWEVHQNAMQYPKIKEEILSIEAALFELSKSLLPEISRKKGFDDLINRIGKEDTVQLPKKRIKKNIYIGGAAAVLLAVGLLWSANRISLLTSGIELLNQQNQVLELQVVETRQSLAESKEFLNIVLDKNTIVLNLDGQKVSPNSNAITYWNKEEKKVYINAQGLSVPPNGFEYQVWSLQLDPLTPTRIGILENFHKNENKIFVLKNPTINESEAFGITLEPKGGSETTTLEQMQTLGTVSS